MRRDTPDHAIQADAEIHLAQAEAGHQGRGPVRAEGGRVKRIHIDFDAPCLGCESPLLFQASMNINDTQDGVTVTCAKCGAKLKIWPEYELIEHGRSDSPRR